MFVALPVIGAIGGAVGSALASRGKKTPKLVAELEECTKVLQKNLAEEQQRCKVLEKEKEESTTLATALLQEKEVLKEQLARADEATAAEVEQYRKQLDDLKQRVSVVLNQLLSKSITETEAQSQLSSMGCKIDYIDPSTSEDLLQDVKEEWNGQTSLLLDNKDRIERLVSHSMTPRVHMLSSNPFPDTCTRMPMITFPSLKAPTRPMGVPPLRLQDSPQPSFKHFEPLSPMDLDTKDKDQSSARAMSQHEMEHIHSKPAIKFVYSSQGQAQSWLAKLPIEGGAAGGYITSTSPTPTYRAYDDPPLGFTTSELTVFHR